MATIKSSFTFKGAGTQTFKAMTPTGTVYDALKGVEKRVFGAVLAGIYQMRRAALELATIGSNEIRRTTIKKGSYKPYVDKRGKLRLSSQPGTPPAATTGGDLYPSIYEASVSKANQNPAVAEFGATADFAADLEFGTPRIPARPFMLPARQKVASVAQHNVARNLRIAYAKSLSKSGKSTKVTVRMDA